MATYIKTIEAYRLEDGEQPQWLKDAVIQRKIIFEKQTMIDAETFKIVKNAIVGIRMTDKTYPIDSYIVKDQGAIRIVYSYDFEREGYKRKLGKEE